MSEQFLAGIQFLTSAPRPSLFPAEREPEFAFVGRSNAGKSSALNALAGVHRLARTSKTPGRTQMVNFFVVPGQVRLVDLPGYGYAKAAKTDHAAWQKLIFSYLLKRAHLHGVVLLMDGRHPLQPLDQNCLDLLVQRSVPVLVLLTKADKLSQSQRAKTLKSVMTALHQWPLAIDVLWFSALRRIGIPAALLWLQQHATL